MISANYIYVVTPWLPLTLQTTLCFNFPNASASISTSALGREATLVPKETIMKPRSPEALTNFSNSGGRGLAVLTFRAPTMTWPNKKDQSVIISLVLIQSYRIKRITTHRLYWWIDSLTKSFLSGFRYRLHFFIPAFVMRCNIIGDELLLNFGAKFQR